MYLMVSFAIAAFGEGLRVGQRRFEELARQQEEGFRPSSALSSEAVLLKHSLRDVAVIGVGLILLVLMIGCILGYRSAQKLDDDRRMVTQTHEVIGSLETLLSTLKDAETGQRGYLLAEDEKYLKPYNDALKRVEGELARLKELTSDNPDQQSRLALLDKKIDLRLDDLKQTVALMKEKDRPAALRIVRSDIGRSLMDNVRKDIADMQQAEHELLKKRADDSEETYRTTVLAILLPAIIGVVLVVVVFYLIQRILRQRQRAALVLAEQKERLRTTLASIGDGVISTDSSGNVTYLNAVAESLTGWTNSDAAGVPLTQVFHIVNESTRQAVENPAMSALKEGVVIGLANHTVLIAKDGMERPIDDSAAPIRCVEGELVGCVLVFRDITERRRSDEALRESEARKSAVVSTALDGIITIDHEGRIIEFNPAAEAMFGYRCAEVMGREMAELIIPPVHWEKHRAGIARYLETGEGPILGQRLTLTAVRSDGTEFLVELAVNRINKYGPPLFTGYIRDITDRKQAEERLREAEEKFRTLADNIPQLAWIADAGTDGQVHWFNKNWFDYTGTTLEEMRGSGWQTVHHPDHAERVIEKFAHHVQEGLDWEDTFPLRRKDGQFRWFLSRMNVIRNEAGAVMRIFGTNTDITEQMQSAEELRKLTAEMSEADHRKDEFLATLAHELRNPLAPIRNGLQVMRLAREDAETVEQTRIMMERQLDQMVRLVDDLMDMSRISRGKLELKMERVQLAAVVKSAVETSRPLIDQMGHELTVMLPKQPVVIDADPTRLAQVFLNLLNNAAKYSDRGGRILLTCEWQGSDVVVSVRDTGIGIAADQLPRIFEMFSQVDRSLEKSQGGLGIGLTLVRRLVEMHGGRVEALSEGMGKGSEFVVRLPVVVEASVPQPPDSEEMQNVPNSSLRVLIVDDNRDSANSLAMMLKIMGNDTRTAYDGQEAVTAAGEFRPAVILLDIGLPKMNGYEACVRIRQQPGGKEIVIIAQTGWGQEEDRRRTHEAGFDYHMVKPVDPQALMKLLEELSVAGKK